MSDGDLDRVLAGVVGNQESSRLADEYLVMPGHGRFELFGCHRLLGGGQGERFRRLVTRTAGLVRLDPALLAVNAIAEHGVSIYLTSREVESQEVGLDYWESLRHSVQASGLPAVGRIHARRVPDATFGNEQRHNVPVYAFADGAAGLLAFAALLKVYDDRIAAAGGPSLDRVTRYALVRYAYNASPQRAVELASRAARGEQVLPTRGEGGPSHPLRTATIRAVQTVAVSEDFFR